jgi:hypothetical protein
MLYLRINYEHIQFRYRLLLFTYSRYLFIKFTIKARETVIVSFLYKREN